MCTYTYAAGVPPTTPAFQLFLALLQLDKFIIEGEDVGQLQKLVVSSDNTGSRPLWHLDHISVFRDESQVVSPELEVYFPCRQWFSSDHGFTKELYPVRRDMEAQKVPYTVKVRGGEGRGRGRSGGSR